MCIMALYIEMNVESEIQVEGDVTRGASIIAVQ